MLEMVLFDWPHLLATLSTKLCIDAVSIAHAYSRFRLLSHKFHFSNHVMKLHAVRVVYICALQSSS